MYAGRRENNRAEAKAFTNKAGFSMTTKNYCTVVTPNKATESFREIITNEEKF